MFATQVLCCTMPLPVTITCSKLQNYKVLSCIFMIDTKKKKKKNRNTISVITEKSQMLGRKILSLSNLLLLESETIFSQKIISERKK